MLGDNESSLKLATSSMFHQPYKHIRIKYHSRRVRIEEGLIELCKMNTGLNDIETPTKHVGLGVLKTCKALVGMCAGG